MEMRTGIAKKLDELNKWQEEQKKLLNERQNMQRQMLGLEQRNMYHMLGLLHKENGGDGDHVDRRNKQQQQSCNDPVSPQLDDRHSGLALAAQTRELERVSVCTTAEGEEKPVHTNRKQTNSTQKTSGNGSGDVHKQTRKTRKSYLKRGEGLKQRFKIDPEALRINNLPRYKFAVTHPSLSSLCSKRGSTQSIIKATGSDQAPQPALSSDAQEKRFQQLLISSNNACNSTPEVKNTSSVCSDMPQIRFVECIPNSKNRIHKQPSYTVSEDSPTELPPMTWSKVLDSQELRPVDMQQIRTLAECGNNSTTEVVEDDQLSIFELLEQKAHDGSIDMNGSSIKQFMARKLREKLGDIDDIPVDSHLKQLGLRPKVQQQLEEASSDEEQDEGEEYTVQTAREAQPEGENSTEYVDSSQANTTGSPTMSLSQKSSKAQLRVRFSVEHNNEEPCAEAASDTSTLVAEDSVLNKTNMFEQFKEALFSALQSRAEKVKNDEHNEEEEEDSCPPELELPVAVADQMGVSPSYMYVGALQQKTNLIKTRLDELEREIATFKDNNMQLLKAKQDHELEKALFTQEHLEAMGRLNDEKIQLEIYLHDERMKIENEKQKFERKIRHLKSTLGSNERKELARVKQELDALQGQVKLKDQTHLAAQARLRAKIRNLEKDQKQLLDDIEVLRKENKRLQNENCKVTREGNTKMLHEINRSIAKLAPKLSTAAGSEEADNTRSKKLVTVKPSVMKRGEKQKMEKTVKNSPKSNKKKQVITHYYSSSDSEQEYSQRRDKCRAQPSEDDCKLAESIHRNSPQLTSEVENKESAESTAPPPGEYKREIVNSDGSKDIWYPNGNLKKISADGMYIRMLYFNKDIKETNINEGTVKYYYATTNTWHTTYLDGLEILEFPNGQTEHRHKDGTVEVHFPNNSIKLINPTDEHKQEEWRFADGTTLVQMRNGDRVLMFANGQKEIHTKLNKRREYPDGTVKLVYPDGSQETRYSNGRVRLKDKDGLLIMDSEMAKN